jgi:hypothetical protein
VAEKNIMLSICTFVRQSLRATSRAGLFVIIALVAFSATATPAFAQSICNAGDQIVVSLVEITASCTVTGSLTIQGGMVRANFTAAPTASLRVEGDVSVTGTGVLWIEGGTFEIQQDHNQHRQMSSTGDATIVFKSTTLVVNQGVGLKYLFYNAYERSKMFAVGSTLDRTTNSLISNHFGDSRLVAINTQYVPSEIYIKERSTITIAEPGSNTGVWLDFEDGAAGTIDLPAQADAGGELQAYFWRVGRSSASLSGVGWQLEIASAFVGLGLESHSGSSITVNGQGAPTSGEIRIAYHVETGVQSLSGLGTGLRNGTLGGDQLALNNVELGPIAWQVYAHDGATLSIHSSILNEIGVAAGGHITVRDSIIQFGAIVSLGSSAASITVHHSQIHSQTIEALRDGAIHIHDSAIFGATVIAHESTSAVNFHGGALLRNRSNACPLILSEMMDHWGVPQCNPWLAPGAAVTRVGSGTISCDATYDCSW